MSLIMCVTLAHIYYYVIWHRVDRCTYPRCALMRRTNRWLQSIHRRGRRWWCAQAHRPYVSALCIATRATMPRHVVRSATPVFGTAHSLYVSSICATSVQCYEGVLGDRYLVRRRGMCVVIRMYLDIRVFPLGGRETRAGALVSATSHAPAYMSRNFYFTLMPGTA